MKTFNSPFGTIATSETNKTVGFNPDGTKNIETTAVIDPSQITDLMLRNAGVTGRVHVQNNSLVFFIAGEEIDTETGETRKMQVSARFRFSTAKEAADTYKEAKEGDIDLLKAYSIGSPNCSMEIDRFRG